MTELSIQSVSKRYGAAEPVLKPFSLEVKSGELVVLVGPSGCGKSTLLKLIAGLEPPSDGRIVLGTRDITDLEPRERRIAMVFQNYALYPHLSVRDNLAYPLRRLRMSRADIDMRVAATALQLRLTELLDRRPAQLSGGQKQRVAMGRAIIREPDLFLLDEPLSNLDASLRAHVRGEIRELQKRLGTTTIYVTHDQVEAYTLADRLVILRDGEVQQIGAPRDIYRHPATLFAATFLGSPPPNLIPASLAATPLPPAVAYLAVRPDALIPAGPETPGEGITIGGRVLRCEYIGNTQLVYFRRDGALEPDARLARLSGREDNHEWVWLTDGRPVGERVLLHAAHRDTMAFDASGHAFPGANRR